jgi:uncharacterized membrane protein (DUF2068 family)
MTGVPTLVKVLAVLDYISAGLLALFGLASLFAAGYLTSVLSSIPILSILGLLGSGIFIFLGIVMLLFSVLDFFIGKGLWKGKNWARILTIVLSSIGAFFSLISLFSGSFTSIISLLIEAAIVGYLGFSKEVKKAFKK